MSPQSRTFWRVFSLWAILSGPVGFGDDADDEPPVQAPAKRPVVHEVNFDQWVFPVNATLEGNGRASENGPVAAARIQLNSFLKMKVDELVRVCHLTEAQRRKLALAGRGDIQRYFDQVEETRKKFLALKSDQNRMNQCWPDINLLRQQFSIGMFNEQSLFAKVRRTTLTEEQQAKYQAALVERRRFSYDVAIEKVFLTLGLGLRKEQRDLLRQFLMEETPPPLLFGPHDRDVVMFGLSKLPADKLKVLLNNEQWKQIQPQLLQASSMEDQLTQLGVIEEPQANAGVVVKGVRTIVGGPAAGDGGKAITPAKESKPE